MLAHWGVDRGPNFEGRSILHVPGGDVDPDVLARARRTLYEVRARRVWPGLDDKRLTAWNALMIAALADAGAVLGRADYLEAARQCARFLLDQVRDRDGRLLRTYKDGRAALNAYLEDHAFLLEALLVLYEATFETGWFTAARALADTMIERFGSPEGGFFDTSSDHEALIVRPRSFEDHPIPSGNSSAAYGLERLAAFTGEQDYERRADEVLGILHQAAARHPQAFGHLLQALRFHFGPRREVALVGEPLDELAAVVRSRFRPTTVVAGMRARDTRAPEVVPLLAGREPVDGRPAAYVCQNFACRMPVTEPAELERELAGLGQPTAALDEHDVAPAVTHLPEALAHSDDPAAERLAQREAGAILGKDEALERPHAGPLGGFAPAPPRAPARRRCRDRRRPRRDSPPRHRGTRDGTRPG